MKGIVKIFSILLLLGVLQVHDAFATPRIRSNRPLIAPKLVKSSHICLSELPLGTDGASKVLNHPFFKKPEVAALLAAFAKVSQALAGPVSAGGLLAGSLHAITGPDHLAAILPASVGKPGLYGAKMGALWGLGHGFSATLLGASAFFLKGKLSKQFAIIEKVSNLANSAVGVSLLLIGLIGIKESMEEGPLDSDGDENNKKGTYGAIFANGVLHGFSWDGVPSIAPAIAMSSWQSAAIFLASYSIGTIIAMSFSAGTVSSLSSGLGKVANDPKLPKKLSFFSSLFAMLIGIYWVVQAFLGR